MVEVAKSVLSQVRRVAGLLLTELTLFVLNEADRTGEA